MLLSSILSILSKNQSEQIQLKTTHRVRTRAHAPFEIYVIPEVKTSPSMKVLQSKQAAEVQLFRPRLPTAGALSASLQEMIRAVAKFENADSKRVVDVFE
jgi:hypothetical protein